MLKKRIIFTLLFDNGQFVLSRNFRLQQVGDLTWLQRNYQFSDVAFYIDELIVLDVSREGRDIDAFCTTLSRLATGCFAPIAAGGGISKVDDARKLLRAGADKIVVNSALFDNPTQVRQISAEFGQQCIIASIGLKRNNSGSYDFYDHNAAHKVDVSSLLGIEAILHDLTGEVYLNSIDRDGTGNGYDFDMLSLLPTDWVLPVIIAGGAGNAMHLSDGLARPQVDAVATAHRFNFIGDGLKRARQALLKDERKLAFWRDISEIGRLKKRSSRIG